MRALVCSFSQALTAHSLPKGKAVFDSASAWWRGSQLALIEVVFRETAADANRSAGVHLSLPVLPFIAEQVVHKKCKGRLLICFIYY